jgi:hypothetical protein
MNYLIAMLLAAMPMAAHAQEAVSEPVAAPVAGQPLLPAGLQPGDKWAELRIEINKEGYPTSCGILQTNIVHRETRAMVCSAFIGEWHTAPIMKDGVAVRGVVTRIFVIPADKKKKKG